jgi:hypothetical protein
MSAQENIWTKKEGIKGGRKEAHTEAFRHLYPYSSLSISLFKIRRLKEARKVLRTLKMSAYKYFDLKS